ncbi:histidine kinase [Streptomyces sp. NBC_00268]|uniref:ATP-binding protein n=1 Tax=Streptomyces sp. NBC_00268 TaxID=2975695 RepID=UPI00225A6EE6|nr:histidine kinase [Streptomyces sp. NBC_00268]MCX5181530.1 histidine kinase [Streptomyces sp. NBC_00268]
MSVSSAPTSVAVRPARIQWPSEPIAWVLAGLIATGGLLPTAAPRSLLPLPLAVSLVLECATGLLLAWRRDRPTLVAAVVAGASLLTVQPALPFAMYSLARRRATSPLRYGVYATAVLSQFTTGAPVVGVMAAALLVGAPTWRGTVIRYRHARLEQLAERAEQAEREALLIARRVRAEERAALAREMHDVVAHEVSLITLHAGALSVDPQESERARETGELIRVTGRRGLAQLRQILDVLRDPETVESSFQPGPDLRDLPQLLADSAVAGVPVDWAPWSATVTELRSGARPLPSAVEHTVYRVVQEALTNIRKHAHGARATLGLGVDGEYLECEVTNPVTGLPGEAAGEGAGLGLRGLRERAVLLGGTLDTGNRDGVFRLLLRLPVAPPAPNQEQEQEQETMRAEPAGEAQ